MSPAQKHSYQSDVLLFLLNKTLVMLNSSKTGIVFSYEAFIALEFTHFLCCPSVSQGQTCTGSTLKKIQLSTFSASDRTVSSLKKILRKVTPVSPFSACLSVSAYKYWLESKRFNLIHEKRLSSLTFSQLLKASQNGVYKL